jgi:hypothetical protein
MRKFLWVLIVGFMVSGCSVGSNSSFQPERPTLAPTGTPTATPAPETCFVDLTNAPIQIAVTGVDITEYCTALIEIDPTRQVLGETISAEPEVCNIEIDPGVYASVRSAAGYTDIAENLCKLFENIDATATPSS